MEMRQTRVRHYGAEPERISRMQRICSKQPCARDFMCFQTDRMCSDRVLIDTHSSAMAHVEVTRRCPKSCVKDSREVRFSDVPMYPMLCVLYPVPLYHVLICTRKIIQTGVVTRAHFCCNLCINEVRTRRAHVNMRTTKTISKRGGVLYCPDFWGVGM